jgi:ABC-type uncharacterized transport system substrate-binding protein
MQRRKFITLLGGAAAAWPLTVRAQQPERIRRIGVMMQTAETDPEGRARLAAFTKGLRDAGWTDGRNVRIDYRWAAGSADDGRALGAELAALTPDVLLAVSTPTLAVLKQETRTIPIIFVLVSDPVGQGFIKSLSHDLESAFATIAQQGARALIIASDTFFTSQRGQIAVHAARDALPNIWSTRIEIEAGGLMSYGANIPDIYRQAGVLAGRILKGARPADLPVQLPTTFDLIINLQTAKALGLTVPPTLLARADEVIE